MEDGYWGLFWETGAPEFYVLREQDGEEGSQQAGRRGGPAVYIGDGVWRESEALCGASSCGRWTPRRATKY